MTTASTELINGEKLSAANVFSKVLPLVDYKASVIVFGQYGNYYMWVHSDPMCDASLRDFGEWGESATVRVSTFKEKFDGLLEVAREIWPSVRIFRVPGCIHYYGIEDLIEGGFEVTFDDEVIDVAS